MTAWDLIITPFILIIILAFLNNARKSVKDKTLRTYFNAAFRVKVIGAIGVGFLYQFYYGRGVGVGDTFSFYRQASIIYNAFFDSPFTYFSLLTTPTTSGQPYPIAYNYLSQSDYFMGGDFRTFNVVRITAFCALFTFNTYSAIALLFAAASFTGVWAIYRVFYDMYPVLHRPLAYAVFFVPSVFFWGSGLVKDSLSLGALGWVFYGFYFGFIKRQKITQNTLIFLLATYALFNLKDYILYGFAGGLMTWLFLQYRANIKNQALRFLMLPVMLVGGLGAGYYTVSRLAENNARFNLDNVANTARVSAEWLEQVGQREGGSVYSLGITDWTPAGLISASPRAVWLAIFQPHPWQARNIIMLLSAAEATFFLWLTLRVLLRNNIFLIINTFLEHPVLLLCLIFTIILGLAVAITSYNYGALVRYRIPYQPFYLAMLYILRYKLNKSIKLY